MYLSIYIIHICIYQYIMFLISCIIHRGADLCNGKAYRYGLTVTFGDVEKRFAYKASRGKLAQHPSYP